jgi:Na+-translocating ferredoxin:NAD+ oxidoreductase RnfC subunit
VIATTFNREQVLAQVRDRGVVGAGGAGFPTHVKLAGKADTVILNAAECEPLLHKDKEMLRHHGREVLEALEQAAQLVGANEIAIGIKGKYHDVIEQLTLLLKPNMRIVPLSDSYPSGDEFILVYDVTKRIIPPGGIPLHVDCVVLNVETAFNMVQPTGVVDKFLTVAGAVKTPLTLRIPVGITYREAVDLCGGTTAENCYPLAGGTMMGKLVQWDDPILKTTGGLIVLPGDHFIMRRYHMDWKAIARIGASACDQCSFCTEFCPRYLLGHPIEPHKAMRSLCFVEDREPTVKGSQFCCECNLCTMMACPEDLDPKNVCTHNKRQLAAAGEKWKVAAHPYRAEITLDNRRVPIKRLINKLGLRHFENTGPLSAPNYKPRKVVLPLQQHIGGPAEVRVSTGQRVKRGDVIAEPAPNALGAVIHASIDGVCRVETNRVVIEAS